MYKNSTTGLSHTKNILSISIKDLDGITKGCNSGEKKKDRDKADLLYFLPQNISTTSITSTNMESAKRGI